VLSYGLVIRKQRDSQREKSKTARTHADAWGIALDQLLEVRKSIKWIGQDTRVKDFLFRLSKGLLYSNSKLEKAGIAISSKCTWFDEEKQTIRHMLGNARP